jgi:hypothetical protein
MSAPRFVQLKICHDYLLKNGRIDRITAIEELTAHQRGLILPLILKIEDRVKRSDEVTKIYMNLKSHPFRLYFLFLIFPETSARFKGQNTEVIEFQLTRNPENERFYTGAIYGTLLKLAMTRFSAISWHSIFSECLKPS